MFLTKGCSLAALEVERRPPRAEVMHATLVEDVNHVVISMSLAVDRCFTALDIEIWDLRA